MVNVSLGWFHLLFFLFRVYVLICFSILDEDVFQVVSHHISRHKHTHPTLSHTHTYTVSLLRLHTCMHWHIYILPLFLLPGSHTHKISSPHIQMPLYTSRFSCMHMHRFSSTHTFSHSDISLQQSQPEESIQIFPLCVIVLGSNGELSSPSNLILFPSVFPTDRKPPASTSLSVCLKGPEHPQGFFFPPPPTFIFF